MRRIWKLAAFMLSLSLTNARGEEIFQIGQEVKFNDSTWVVLSASDLGSKVKSDNPLVEDLDSLEGKFIKVVFKVRNEKLEEERIIFTPSIKDSKGRRFEEIDEIAYWVGKREKAMEGNSLPAGLGQKFVSIFETPQDSVDFFFMARSLGIEKDEKGVRLGIEEEKKRKEEESAKSLAEQEMRDKEEAQKSAKEATASIAKIDERLNELRKIIKQDADRINQLTNLKRTPVKEGSREYYLCVESSQRIQIATEEGKELVKKKKLLEGNTE